MMINPSFYFEMAAWLDDSQSTACTLFGVFDNGKRVTVVTKDGIGYTYKFKDGRAITKDEFHKILSGSVGRFWVKTLKTEGELVDKDAAANNWIVKAKYWAEGFKTGVNLEEVVSQQPWQIKSDSLYAF